MTAIVAFGIMHSCSRALAQDSAPPNQFELLVPGHNAAAYASIHGSTPLLAWQESSDGGSGLDHYEVWLDGAKVDDVPAGAHGHLPGGRHGNYAPFRPFGFLAAENACYYTPPASKLTPGPHQWWVNAVDRDGNKRRSNRVFRFTVEELGSPRVFVNHLGHLPGGSHRVVVDGRVEASSFDVVAQDGTVVFSGDLRNGGNAFGDYLCGDFSGLGDSGTYRVRAGSEYSMWFPIGLGAKLNYETCLRKYRNAYTRKRCGNTTANWGGKACHLDDARMDGGARHAIAGGWHASSDVRKIMRILQPALTGLIEMKRVINPAWDGGEYGILDEIRWGNRYIHEMQLENGAVVQHYYLWCGATDWSEAINRYTNNVIGDEDDRLLPDKTLVVDMVSQSRFIENQSTIYRLYKKEDPEYADRCLKAATRCYEHFAKTWPVVTDYETTFNARPYEEQVTDLMPLAYGVRANLCMFLATDDPACRDRAVALADQLVALQETDYIEDQAEVRGFFYANPDKESIFSSYMAHGGLDGAPGAVLVLADLCDALPAHAKCPRWRESLRSYLEDYLLPLSTRNAFGIVPGYLSREPLVGGRQVGGLHYQFLDDNRGVNKFLVRKAILLAKGARILGNPELRDAAWRQLDWVLGNNPLNASTVYGVGQGQPKLYKAHLAPRSDGMVVQGIGGDAKDRPFIKQGHWRHCEMELHHTAWFAQALCELLAIAPATAHPYSDGRPAAGLRMDAKDHGIVLRHGDGPEKCDLLGARDVWVFEDGGTYYMHYDAAGPNGWLCSLATSKDLLAWDKKGPVLDFGKSGEDDSKGACYGVTYQDGDEWHMFYLGTPNVTPPPNLIPGFPYLTMKARGDSPAGPWVKQKDVVPFRTKPGTYYSLTASPGHVIRNGDEYLQFFSATTRKPGNPCVQRTLGIARTKDLDGPWTVDPQPIVPIEEQIENSSLYFEESIRTWFLFTNHIGIERGEFTDAIWVYWSKDLDKWDAAHKAVVLDGRNCSWSSKCIGLPSVVPADQRLALFYDAPGGDSTSHMKRHVGLAWLELPLSVPTSSR